MKWDIAPEYISLILILILLISSKDKNQNRKWKDRLFLIFLQFSLVEILFSILSILAIENYLSIPILLNEIIQMIYFLLVPILSVLFTLYIISVAWEGSTKITRTMNIALIPYIVYIPFVLSNPFTHLLFEFNALNGFVDGQWAILAYIVHLVYIIVMLAIALMRRNILKKHLTLVLISFPIISLLMLFTQLILPRLILSGSLAAISALIVYLYIQNEQKQNLKESEERFRNLFALKGDALFVIDKTTNDILEVNDSACKMYGYSREEMLLLKSVDISAEPEETDRSAKELADDHIDIPLRYHKKKDGTLLTVELNVTVFIWDNKQALLVVSKDISEKKAFEDKLIFLSYHDQLTGLYNRRFFEEELIRLDTNRNLPITIAMGDVNGLKLVNDSFGHPKGDQLLKSVANALRRACRDDDIIARLGGDEFAIILPKTAEKDAEKIIARIVELTSNETIEGINISISFGAQTKNASKEDISTQLKEAEEKMYRNKISESLSMRNKTIDLIMHTLFEKSMQDMEHSQRVSELCVKIANEMKLGKDAVNRLRTVGLMHDIGKIAIDERILNSKTILSKEDWVEIRKHSEIGYRILNASVDFVDIADDVYAHHERWDGKGYPRGIKGEAISIFARIINVADSYDAMISDRPYRVGKKSMNPQEALREIKKCAGTQFDPEVAKIFVEKVMHTKW